MNENSNSKERIARLKAAWRVPSGWRYWSAVNNNQVGNWYILTAFVFFLFAGVLALLMRVQLAVPENDFLSADTYNQVFTMHGSVMMFLFAVPIFEAFAIQMLPSMLGTRELPLPRMSTYGFWCFLLGGVFVCASIFFNAAPKGGWFMYPPLSIMQEGIGNDIWLLGLSFIEIAAIAASVELIIAVLRTRAPGMRINLVPLYAWYILVVAGMILFAFPPLIAGDLLFELARAFDWPFFDPARGGDPLLWQHLFWIFGHPEVYIIFLPAIALIAMIVPTAAQRPIVGYSWIVLAAIGTGFLSFGLWVHHMFTTGLPNISLAFFSAASEAVAIPTAVQIFCFLATAYTGRFVRSVPMLFAAGGLAIFVIGGLTGVMVAIVPFDLQAHDTYFIVAHLHYVLIGGMLFPVAAGFHYYFPIAAGRMLSERLGRLSFWMMFIGFNVAFMPMHFTGLAGMPRRVYTYTPGLGFDLLNLVSTVGAFLFAVGIAVIVYDALRARRNPRAQHNPWRAGTLEWLGDQPLTSLGIYSIPHVESRYPLWDQPHLVTDIRAGRGYLADAPEGRRETLLTSTLDAVAQFCQRVPGPSFLPMLAAITTGGAFIFLTYKWWFIAGASALLAISIILYWLWSGTGEIPEKPAKDIGRDVVLPLYAKGTASVGWWGLLIAMIADIIAYFSLVFGYFFFWTVHDDFPPANAPDPGTNTLLFALGALLGAWLLTWSAQHFNAHRRYAAFHIGLFIAFMLAGAGTFALVSAPVDAGYDPVTHVYPAIVWVLVGWTAVHAALGMLMQLYVIARRAARRMNSQHDIEIHVVALYWHFVAITVFVTVAIIAGFPKVS